MLLPAPRVQAQDNATCLSQIVPTSMTAGQQYSVSVTMQNTGTSTWTDANNYRLGSANVRDNTTWSAPLNGNRVVQPLNVPPGGKATFAFVVTAPPSAGTYNFQWQMLREGTTWFGSNSANVAVAVAAGAASNSQVPVGGSASVGFQNFTDNNFGGVDTWTITTANGAVLASGTGGTTPTSSPAGWGVSKGMLVTVPPGTTPSTGDTAVYDIKRTAAEVGTAVTATFDIVALPPTAGAPAPTGAPYAWQAAVGGVNTANGNKFVSVPIVGWTARGGMPVGISLAWNSQAPNNNNPTNAAISGPKWTFNYEVFLVQNGSTVTLTWGDGRSYSFVRNTDGTYTPPKGIYDTLTPNANNSFDLKTKGQIVYHFGFWGAAHYLTSIVDENGGTLTLSRGGGARINTVTDPSGRTLTLGYDSSLRLSTVTDNQTGRLWTLGYNSGTGGTLASVTWPALNGTSPSIGFKYDANPNLQAFDDLNGHVAWRATYLSAPYCALATEWDIYNNNTNFDYTSGTKVTNANNQATTYAYTGGATGTLGTVKDPLGYTDVYVYDANNNLKQHTDRRNKVWAYGVDTMHGNTTTSSDAMSPANVSSALYDARNSKTLQTTDALGHSTTFVYDAGGFNLQSTTDALGHTSTVNGYWWGLPTSVSDALGHTSTMAYDGDGNVVRATDANGNSSTATYNRAGWKLTATDALGQTVGSRYDAWGRVTSVNALPTAGLPYYKLVSGDGNHSFETANQSEYNSAVAAGWQPQAPVGGIFAGSTDVPNLVPLYRMRENGAGDRFYTTDANLRSTAINSWGYVDEGIAGYVLTAPAAGFKPVYYAWLSGARDYYTDDANEYNTLPAPWNKSGILFYVWNNTASTTYDNNGNVLTVTDQNGHTTTNTYDNDNRLLSSAKANGDTVTYQYDADPHISNDAVNNRRGRLVYKTDGNGSVLGYVYTVRGELSQIGYPDGTNEYFHYNENSDLDKYTKRDSTVITYGYDNDSRLISTTYPAGGITPNVSQDYTPNGLPFHLYDGTGTTIWTYDAADRLTQMQAPGSTVSYGYDDAGRPTSMTQGGRTSTSTYDDGGRLKKLSNGLGNIFDFTYDNDNRLKVRDNETAVATGYTYNSAGLVTNVTSNQNDGGGGTLNTDTYAYDASGNRTFTQSYDGITTYGYDGADQLTNENHSAGYPAFSASYTYDHNGNRLTKSVGGQTDTYHYQTSHSNASVHTDTLLSVTGGVTGGLTLTYNRNGDATSITKNGQTLYLTADAEERYTRFDFNTGPGQGSAVAWETYNGLGLRVFRHDVWGGDHTLAYSGTSPGDALLSDSNNNTLYTPGLMQQDSSGQHFWQLDALGSVRGVSNNAQSPLGEVYYDAFGLPAVRQGQQPLVFGFAGGAGYQSDNDTGLMLLGNRYYDSDIGRFLTPDPSGDGDNWYAYCDNNPLDAVDPEGLDPQAPSPNFSIDGIDLGNGFAGQRISASNFSISNASGHWEVKNNGSTNPYQHHNANGTIEAGRTENLSSIWVFDHSPLLVDEITRPVSIPDDWIQIRHEDPKGGTRWINPNGTEGLEHNPMTPGSLPGTHGAQDHTHTLILNPRNGKWDYTNPKDYIPDVKMTPHQGAVVGGTTATAVAVLILKALARGAAE